MSFKLLKILLITSCFIFINTADYLEIPCGKKDPEKDTHCSKYGTDSGFLCCWIIEGNEAPKCRLMSHGRAKELGIKGEKNFTDTNIYYACGNSSTYLKDVAFAIIAAVLSCLLF